MKIIENKKITSVLFHKDIRNEEFAKDFEKLFKIEILDFLSDYEYDEIDEFPIEIMNKGIMIGFMAETIKVPPQIEYVDLDVYNYPENINYLEKIINIKSDFLGIEEIKRCLSPCSNLRIYYSIHNMKELDRIIFQDKGLRYELSITENIAISRIRICFGESESDMNMRTYYPFE